MQLANYPSCTDIWNMEARILEELGDTLPINVKPLPTAGTLYSANAIYVCQACNGEIQCTGIHCPALVVTFLLVCPTGNVESCPCCKHLMRSFNRETTQCQFVREIDRGDQKRGSGGLLSGDCYHHQITQCCYLVYCMQSPQSLPFAIICLGT